MVIKTDMLRLYDHLTPKNAFQPYTFLVNFWEIGKNHKIFSGELSKIWGRSKHKDKYVLTSQTGLKSICKFYNLILDMKELGDIVPTTLTKELYAWAREKGYAPKKK